MSSPSVPSSRLLIPFAAPLAEAGRAALATLPLPRLQAALARCDVAVDAGDEWSFTPPHERAQARAWGWSGGDGQLPFAARAAAEDGLVDAAVQGDLAWGLVTPVHWHVGTDQVSLLPPSQLMLAEAESRALFEALRPLFTDEGFVFAWGAPLRWYAAHESLAGLRTASLDRVIGRNVDPWLGSDPAARRIRRLQAEVQMLLYTHPVNDEREARGLLPVNSFWLSGCGVAQPLTAAPIAVDDRLRSAALTDDWPGWTRAWETLDEGPIAAWLDAASGDPGALLVLAGERSAASLTPTRRGWWQALRSRLAPSAPRTLLETL